MRIKKKKYILSLGIVIFPFLTSIAQQAGNNWVDATTYKIIDGAWCWFQDERAVVDTAKNKLIVGVANMQSGVDLALFNIGTKKVESTKRFGGLKYSDDHNAPAVLIAPNGNYIAMWAHHYDEYNHHYSIYKEGSGWSGEKKFDWTRIPGGTDYTIAYSNLYYLSVEKRIYCFSRANHKAPNFIYSMDNGESWKYGGQLTTNSSNSYNKGYYKYWGNGMDRIDMVFTEEHPRDTTTSIYHGYIQGGKTYNTEGKVADENIFDTLDIPTFESFTKVFAHGTKVNGTEMGRCWQHDIVRYDDGTIAILFKARANNSINDHRNFYARYDGKEWKVTYLGKAGGPMYADEEDYVGLGALNPDDPTRIYLSTAYNPGNDTAKPASKREIWRGITTDKGATWKWEKVTSNSTRDNFRPIVPKWKPGKEVLLWFRGTYTSAQNFSTEVVATFYEYTPLPPPPETTFVANSSKVVKNVELLSCLYQKNQITFQYQLQSESRVTIDIFSLCGKKISTLYDGKKSAGKHRVIWNTTSIPKGTYITRIIIGNYIKSSIFHVQ
ncbi:MAG: BNR-4 repeat-containing protein [Chitinispirillaceae bacterium]|nr:BNR-4 repeat-containing protein [Chitinispirillaceae bacterium]